MRVMMMMMVMMVMIMMMMMMMMIMMMMMMMMMIMMMMMMMMMMMVIALYAGVGHQPKFTAMIHLLDAGGGPGLMKGEETTTEKSPYLANSSCHLSRSCGIQKCPEIFPQKMPSGKAKTTPEGTD